MTKEELEKEAEEYLENKHCKNVCTRDEIEECKEGVRIRCTSFDYRKKLIVNFAEPREKRIEELEAIVRNTKATDESFALLTLQLIEAKKIIRSLLTCCRNYPQENAEKMRQAEKFIKDSEVVK